MNHKLRDIFLSSLTQFERSLDFLHCSWAILPPAGGKMACRPKHVDDTNWDEVFFINRYTLFMGYLSMAIRGLGFLVLTWTTVILLGGFVSILQKKDFWCLTFITLVQIAGVFEVYLNEKLSYIGKSAWGLYLGAMSVVMSTSENYGLADTVRQLIGLVVGMVHLLVLAILLCPLAAVYMFGQFISTGISLWRLRQHDFGGSKDGEANLKLALYVLYSLALVQGVLFCYRFTFARVGPWIVKGIAERNWHKDYTRQSVLEYLQETKKGCEKDLSFARGRNLITYAVDLMESKSPDSFVSGVRILDVFIRDMNNNELNERRMLVKHLIRSGPASHILEKLLHMLDPKSPHDGELRKRASRILVQLASEIRLQHFPGGIQCIFSLLDASRQEVDDYRELVLQGFRILKELATDEHNCKVMSDASGLLSEITRPVSSDLLHRVDHVKWSKIVDASLQVMCCLLASARGEAGANLRREISSNREAIRSMQFILTCDGCVEERHILAMKILTQVTQPDTQSRGDFIDRLLRIFTDTSKNSHVRGLAGQKLATLSLESESNARFILQAQDHFVCINDMILREGESNECRISAAGILEGLCRHYTSGRFRNLDEAIVYVMPMVLTQILPQESIEAENAVYLPKHTDIETGNGGVRRHNAPNEDKKLQAALLSFCVVVYDKWIIEYQDLVSLFNMVAPGDDAFSFPMKLEEMVQRTRHSTNVDCLRMMKHITKMAISMRRHKSSYEREDLRRLMRSLSSASEYMLKLDGYMLFSGGDNGKTLTSLVGEAQKLLM